ncbi:hypothetical protein, partial [Stenotrophomonas maltophilia]|uniref:hypothetical protein n=1 Tax=Stenotrophomonas maltophilia TaxID=40324 RepID=UPI0013D98E9A
SYYDDWLDAFMRHSGFRCVAVNIFGSGGRRRAARLVGGAELVVILHSGTGDTLDYVKALDGALQNRRGKLIVFMGNEFNV